MPGFRLEERAVDGIGRCAAMAMDSGRGRAQSPSRTPTPMGILVVTKTDATLSQFRNGTFLLSRRASFAVAPVDPGLVAPTYCLEETAVPQGASVPDPPAPTPPDGEARA